MSAVEKLLTTARAEIGYHEKASNANLDDKTANSGSANYTKYARDLDALGDVYNGKKNGYDWCDVFVDWCFITTFGEALGMKLLCQPYKGLGAGTGYSLGYYKAKGQFHSSGPQPGDQIFFGNKSTTWHTGIVEKVEGSKVYTIEGNTGTGSVKVARCVYPLTYGTIKGYGRPDWTLVKNNSSETKPSAPVVAVNYRGKVTASPNLRVRTKADITSSVVSSLPHGTIVHITKEQNGWGYMGTGWCSLEWIEKITEPEQPEKEDDDMDLDGFKKLWSDTNP